MFQDFITHLGLVLLILNVLLYFKVFLSLEKSLKIFSIYLLFISVIQIISFVLWNLKINNIFLSHYYFVIQFILLSLFFMNIFLLLKQKRKVLIVLIISLSVITLSYIINPDLYYSFNIYEIALTSVPIIYFSVLQIFNSLLKEKKYLYINTGILFYILLSTLIFIAGNNIINLPDYVNDITWVLNSILFIIFQLLIFYEWYKNLRHKKEILIIN